MSSFAESQILFSHHQTTLKLRKNLSIQTSISTRRGLSLVSSRGGDSISSSKKSSLFKDPCRKSPKKSTFKFFQCSIPLCDIPKLAQHEELVELKPKKVLSHTIRQRNMNVLSRGMMDNFSSTQTSYCGSNADTLWHPKSPVNKIFS